jgi:hypothetical protein
MNLPRPVHHRGSVCSVIRPALSAADIHRSGVPPSRAGLLHPWSRPPSPPGEKDKAIPRIAFECLHSLERGMVWLGR